MKKVMRIGDLVRVRGFYARARRTDDNGYFAVVLDGHAADDGDWYLLDTGDWYGDYELELISEAETR